MLCDSSEVLLFGCCNTLQCVEWLIGTTAIEWIAVVPRVRQKKRSQSDSASKTHNVTNIVKNRRHDAAFNAGEQLRAIDANDIRFF